MLGSGQRAWGIWIVAGSACVLIACADGNHDANSDPNVHTTDPASPSEEPADPFPCMFTLGTSGPFGGTCTAAWHATDAGSVTNFVRFEVTMSSSTGLGAGTPCSMSLSGTLNDGATSYDLGVTLGAQASHAQGTDLTEISHVGLAERWQGSGGVVLYLTAESIETYAYSHFEMHGVHGSFDMADPFVVHAAF